jgi:class 3 adenylate cyclase/tetratricopeptide (TPR) repeat protein
VTVRCDACGSPNPAAALECSSCGAEISAACPACGAPAPPGARFCSACGLQLSLEPRAAGERRQITVLFGDLVASTPLSQTLDPEDLQQVLESFQEHCATEIERQGGRVAQNLGDGVLAYFGHPRAHEDDAARAVTAALRIVESLPALNARLGRLLTRSVCARLGLHTGIVVVGDIGSGAHHEVLAVGETVNLASRLPAIAEPNEVVLTEETRRLADSAIETESLGARTLRGIAGAVSLHRAVRLRRRTVRGPVFSPLVGRQRELRELCLLLESLLAGQGSAVLIRGDAGIGKTRLVESFRERVEASGGDWLGWTCARHMEGTALHPIVASLEQRLALDDSDPAVVRARIEAELTGTSLTPSERVATVARLLSLELPEGRVSSSNTAEAQRRQTLEMLLVWATSRASGKPAVLVAEDLQWADPSTLEVLAGLLARCRESPLLLVGTIRSDSAADWKASGAGELTLPPLDPRDSRQLVDTLLGESFQSDTLREELVEKSDGVPLFIEEIARTLLTSGDGAAQRSLPSTLRGLLMSRLDSVSKRATETLHLASAIGRHFSARLLAAAASRGLPEIERQLQELQRSGLVVEEAGSDGEHAFRHALVQDAVYDSMVRSERQSAHRRVSDALAAVSPERIAERPEVLAHHLTEAALLEPAISQWELAGKRAISRGAYQEAIGHFDRALALVEGLDASPHRYQTELALVESKGTALFSSYGYADPRVEEIFRRALGLCEQLGSAAPLRTLYGLWGVQVARGAREEVEVLLPMIAACAGGGDPVASLTAHGCTGLREFLRGNFARCAEEMDQAMRWYSSPEYTAFVAQYGYEGGLYLPAYRMWSVWLLGRPDRAQELGAELDSLASHAQTPYGHCIAAGFRLNLARDRGEYEKVISLASEQIAHAERQLIYLWQGPAHCSRGWAVASLGDPAAGIAEIRGGLALIRAIGLVTTRAYHTTALVEALLLAGAAEEALVATREALELCERSLDAFCESELRRLEGEALLALGRKSDALAAMRAALDLAERRGARSYALRAATSLARVAQQSGDDLGARTLLAPIFGQFTEGFETRDLREARALLESRA